MRVSNDMDAAIVDAEVLLVCLVGGERTVCLARPHWFDDGGGTRVLRWQNTWSGEPIPSDWRPFAWGSFEEIDRATEDVI